MRLPIAFATIGLPLAIATNACVGDSPNTEDAGAADGSTDEGADVAGDVASDVTADGPTQGCNPKAAFGAPSQIQGLATGASVFLSSSGLDAYFSATLDGGAGAADLYTAHRIDVQSPFGSASGLTVLNSNVDDGSPTLTADGLTIVFDSARSGNNDIYSAGRSATTLPFGAPVALAINTGAVEAQPFIRADGQVLYYRLEVTGNNEIYRATKGGVGFANPAAVAEINTTSSEISPVITPDDLTVFFASTRTDGQAKGGYDIWSATRQKNTDPFGAPTNISELNTTGNDVPTYVSGDGCTLYFDRSSPANVPFMATRGK